MEKTMDNMFAQALRKKIRFNTSKGLISTEDLWDVPLTANNGFSLDDIAKDIHRELKGMGEESFVNTEDNINNDRRNFLELQLSIVKYIIDVKLAERKKRQEERINAQKKETLLSILEQKKNEQLKDLSIEDLEKMLEEIK
jgi:hypothetical protein